MKNDLIPILTSNFLNYFKTINLNNKICVEIGSGNSTIYWSNYFKKIISYENNIDYYNKIKNCIKNINNIELLEFNKNIFDDLNFKKNIQKADVIIIDNDPKFINRKYFCVFAKKNRKKDNIIILDNGTWNLDAYDYMLNNFFCLDFPGINRDNEVTVTSIFFKEKTKEYYVN